MIKIFIGGLPPDIEEKELAQRFAEFGEVVDCTVIRNPGNQSRGRGWIVMKHVRDAMCAVQALNRATWGNRTLVVGLARERGRRPANGPANNHATVFVGNLPYAITEEDLEECFSQYGEVMRATVVKDRVTGRPRGFAFVELAEAAAAEQAARDLHGADWGGRVLTVCMGRRDGETEKR